VHCAWAVQPYIWVQIHGLANFFIIIKAQCTCFEVNFSQQARYFNDVLYNLWVTLVAFKDSGTSVHQYLKYTLYSICLYKFEWMPSRIVQPCCRPGTN